MTSQATTEKEDASKDALRRVDDGKTGSVESAGDADNGWVPFTPGPWEWDECAQIVEAARPRMRVAFLPSDGLSYACGEPNARLITAAPDMYHALLGAEEWLSGWASAEPYIDTIRAALDKANPSRTGATTAPQESTSAASDTAPEVTTRPSASTPNTPERT